MKSGSSNRSFVAALSAASALLLFARGAEATTYYFATVNGVTYVYSVTDNKAYIGTGDSYPAISSSTSGALSIPSTLGGYTVAGLGDFAFLNCTNLTSALIPASVSSVGASAFNGCTNMTMVIIPSGVSIIGDSAFYRCARLGAVSLPATVTMLGSGVFWFCNTLTNITVASGNTAYVSANGLLYTKNKKTLLVCPGGKTGAVTVPSGVKEIADSAFWACGRLTSVTVTEGVTNIANSAFYNCSGLTSLSLPASLENIGDWAFGFCIGLKSLALGNKVRKIGGSSFYSCNKLTSLTIPGSVTNIGSGTFQYCYALTNVYLLGNAPTAGSGIYQGITAPLTNYVGHGSTGWDGTAGSSTLPATWQNKPIAEMSPSLYCKLAWGMDGFSTTGVTSAVTFTTNVATVAGAVSGDSHTAGLTLTTGNGQLVFRWKVSSEESADYARYTLDGTVIAERSGKTGEWEWVTNTVSTGTSHTWAFIYTKDISDFGGEDTAWFTDFSWRPFWKVDVTHGTGNGVYFEGDSVTVTAAPPLRDSVFVCWSGDTNLLSDATAPSATFTMPGTNVSLTATYSAPYETLAMLNQIEAAFGLASGSVGIVGETNAVTFMTNIVAASGAVAGDGKRAGLSVTTTGNGRLVFRWNVSSELSDVAVFAMDGDTLAMRSGKANDWQWVTNTVTSGGTHVWTFTYVKDANSKAGLDTAWFSDLMWIPAQATLLSPIPVPYSWLDGYGLAVGGDYEKAATNRFANGVLAWESYLSGLNPTDPSSAFIARIAVSNGNPRISWTPDLGVTRKYTVEGKANLNAGGAWAATNSASRVFRVRVNMP